MEGLFRHPDPLDPLLGCYNTEVSYDVPCKYEPEVTPVRDHYFDHANVIRAKRGVRGGYYPHTRNSQRVPGIDNEEYDELLALMRITFVNRSATPTFKKKFIDEVETRFLERTAENSLKPQIRLRYMAALWHDFMTVPSELDMVGAYALTVEQQMGMELREALIAHKVDNQLTVLQRLGVVCSFGIWRPLSSVARLPED